MTAADVCASLRDDLPSLFSCRVLARGDVRVRTPMQYPDGGFVDVFVVRGEDGHHLVTDYGDAFGWLRMNSISGKLTPNQRTLVDDVALTLGVELDRGQLQLVGDGAPLADHVQRLAQAAVRVADISFTFRAQTTDTVADDVDEWLRSRSFEVQRGVRQRGPIRPRVVDRLCGSR